MRAKSPFQVGARVKIVTPAFVVRVGYPLDFEAESRRVAAERRAEIEAFVRAMGVRHDPPHRPCQAVGKIAKALAYDLCKQAGWGGRERKIYTKNLPDFAGVETTVISVRFAKTGEYTPGCSGGFPDDYSPPFLSHERTHRLLRLTTEGVIDDTGWFRRLEIEAANVELVAAAVDELIEECRR